MGQSTADASPRRGSARSRGRETALGEFSSLFGVSFWLTWWPALAALFLSIQIARSLTVLDEINPQILDNIIYAFVLILGAGLAARNALQSSQSIRLFWSFLAVGFGLWAINPLSWTYSNLVLGRRLPSITSAGLPLFLHIVLFIAAVAARPHLRTASQRPYRTTLNFLLLLFFWVFLYAYLIVPLQSAPVLVAGPGFETLYFAENLFLIVALGILAIRTHAPWKLMYLHLFGASLLYALGSLAANWVLFQRGYSSGILAVPYTSAAAWFVWLTLKGRALAPQLAQAVQLEVRDDRYASIPASLAVIGIPLIGIWELFRADEPYETRTARLLIVLIFLVVLAAAAFLQHYLANRGLASEVGLAQYFLRLALQAGRGAVWEVDLRTGENTWFGDLSTLFGIAADRLSGTAEDFHRYVHPQDRDRVSEALEDARAHAKPFKMEFRIVRQDGAVLSVSASGKFYYASNGMSLRMVGMAVDITDRKASEEALKKSEEKFSKAFRQSPLAFILTSAKDHRYVEVNETFERLTGWSRDEVIGRTPIDLGIWVDPEQVREFIGRLLFEGGVRDQEVSFRTKGGEIRTGQRSGQLIEVNGEPCALSVMADITERKLAEGALREGEERFRLVANAAPVMIWMSGTDKLCTYFNQPWLEFTGRSIGAEMGNGWAEGVHPEDLQPCLDTYSAAFDSREAFEMEYRLRRHDGEYRWVRDFGVPRFNADGSFAGYIGSCYDVTDRRRAEEALSTVSRKLIEAHEEERTWIARELHDDINQRVAMLAVTLEHLKQNLPASPAETRCRLEEAHEQVTHLGTEIQALSHRLHSSKLEYLGLVAAAAGFCKEFSEGQKVEIDFQASGIPKQMPEEVSLCLFRVLQEAVQNAARHSRSNHIQVSLGGSPGEIQLRVSDSGIGFDPDEAVNGRGIGLISMKERLKLVNGELSIDSQLRRGTVVRATVPLRLQAKAAHAAA